MEKDNDGVSQTWGRLHKKVIYLNYLYYYYHYVDRLDQCNWASVSEPIITWTVSMAFLYVCMYVYMCGGHSVLRSNSKLRDNFGKMETHARPWMPCIILVLLYYDYFQVILPLPRVH